MLNSMMMLHFMHILFPQPRRAIKYCRVIWQFSISVCWWNGYSVVCCCIR